jgi:5-oxoprolinase (ATP-hydrolysing) subunit A
VTDFIDINADAGESFGRWALGDDETFLPHVSSVNVACGFHAGDPVTMRRTVRIAKQHGIAVGAHPGLPDLLGFGRRMMSIDSDELVDSILFQIGALGAIAATEDVKLAHVKPHGALYKMLSVDPALSAAVGAAIARLDPGLFLVLLAGSGADAAEAAGARVVREAFIDLDYDTDGGLIVERNATPRDPEMVAARAVRVVREGKLSTLGGTDLTIKASTLCLHGDRSNSSEVARVVNQTLRNNDIKMAPLADFLC